jgi:hypothetical protein
MISSGETPRHPLVEKQNGRRFYKRRSQNFRVKQITRALSRWETIVEVGKHLPGFSARRCSANCLAYSSGSVVKNSG